MSLKKEELLKVEGGALSGTLINSIISAITTLYNYGKSLGSSLRRLDFNKICTF